MTEAEELEFARTRFIQVFGQSARDWTIVMSPAPAGASRLCAAVDEALVGAVNRRGRSLGPAARVGAAGVDGAVQRMAEPDRRGRAG